MPSRRRADLLVCGAALVLSGCFQSDSGVVVRGQLILDGSKLVLAENEAVLMSLSPVDGSTSSGPFSGSVQQDGRFVVVRASNGKGIPPGKYRVTLQTLLTDREHSVDRFGGRYAAGKSNVDVLVVKGMGLVTISLTPTDG